MRKHGFTLIELLVVISIIGVLTALLLPNLVGIRGRASDSRIKGDLVQLKNALRIYYNDFQAYPAHNVSNVMMGCGTGTSACTPGGMFSANSVVYMRELPEDFSYTQTDSGEGFLLSAELQNASDNDLPEAAARCGQTHSAGDVIYYVCSD